MVSESLRLLDRRSVHLASSLSRTCAVMCSRFNLGAECQSHSPVERARTAGFITILKEEITSHMQRALMKYHDPPHTPVDTPRRLRLARLMSGSTKQAVLGFSALRGSHLKFGKQWLIVTSRIRYFRLTLNIQIVIPQQRHVMKILDVSGHHVATFRSSFGARRRRNDLRDI